VIYKKNNNCKNNDYIITCIHYIIISVIITVKSEYNLMYGLHFCSLH